MRSKVLRQKNVSALLYFFCARSISLKFYFHLVFQFKPQHNTSNTTNYGTSDLMSVESLGSIVILLIAVTLKDSNRNKVVRLLLALISKRSRLTATIFTIFFLDSQANYPDPDASTASR